MRKFIKIVLLFVLAFPAIGFTAEPLDRIIAIVNREAIPESELNRQIETILSRLRHNDMNIPPISELKKQVLEKMILEKLQLQMAKEAGIDVTEEMLKKSIE